MLSERFLDFGYDLRHYANLKADDLHETITDLAKEKDLDDKEKLLFNKYGSLVVLVVANSRGPRAAEPNTADFRSAE